MGILGKIVLVVFAISFFTFVALFGQLPALRKTPIGLVQRILCLHIPNKLRSIDHDITGGTLTASTVRLTDYLLYQKNPVILIIFMTILTVAATLFLWATHPQISRPRFLLLLGLILLPYRFTYLCARSRALYITPSTHSARMHDYPYDNVLYHPNQLCRTCHLAKPARSKHCTLCGVCIAKSDHHCPWVNNCLGRDNYRWFLALLLSLVVLEVYSAWLAQGLLSVHLRPAQYSALPWLSTAYWSALADDVMNAIHVGGICVAGVGLLVAMTAPLPLVLLAYHVYLVWAGMTTNETSKWADWREDMADGVVFKARHSAILADEELRRRAAVGGPAADDGQVELDVAWPVSSDQHVVRTSDGKPPVAREHLYEQIWTLNDVDNIFDLGFADNLLYALRGR